MRRVFGLMVLILVTAGLLFSGCEILPTERVDAPPPLIEPPAPRVTLHTVSRGDILEQVSGLARVAAYKEQDLYYTQSGRVGELFVGYNDPIEEGQPLVRLEAGDLEYNHQMAYLNLKREELRRDRLLELAEAQGFMNQYEWELNEIEYTRVKLAFDRLDERLQAITLYAPFDGIVTAVRTRIAARISEYETLLRVADPSQLELQMTLGVQDFRKVLPGMSARVRLASGQELDAFVRELDSGTADNPERIVRLDVVEEQADKVAFNQLLQTRIFVQESLDTLLIPRAALREFRDRTFVHVMDGDQRKEVDVETGLQDRTHVEILSGLEEGQQVIGR